MNSFLRKVEAERNVLSVVNAHTTGKSQLAGLSCSAINNWCSVNAVSVDHKASVTLRSLADLCNSLSDRSNENFMRIPTERLHRIEAEIVVLRNSIRALYCDRV